MPVVMAYGMGTNSVAMLVGLKERGENVDLILSADTGGERPETYEHRDFMSRWCESNGFPEIVCVKKGGMQETLEENCLRMQMLPSIAYGFKSCSQKYKRLPQDTYCNNWQPARDAWKRGERVVKLIGYDADEERRAQIKDDAKYIYRYPLIEWGWDRDDCIAAIERAGIPQPGKSACFFCPSSKREEIENLKKEHPLLFQRALNLEKNAEPNLGTVMGLGRRFSWHEHADGAEAARFVQSVKTRKAWKKHELQQASIEMPCGCYEG